MTVSANELLDILPPYANKKLVIEYDQDVHDIVREVIEAHKYFAVDYDYVYQFFDTGSIKEICEQLFNFCKQNIVYRIESEDKQTTKSPAAILALGCGDCKHYASFIAGVLSAIVRNTGRQINWSYTFACYSMFDTEIQHVFVTVRENGNEYWIDPVLSYFNARSPLPVFKIDKRVNNNLMLTRISGIGVATNAGLSFSNIIDFGSDYLQANAVTQSVQLPADVIAEDDYYATDVPADVIDNIKMLLYYGIIDDTLNISSEKYLDIVSTLAPDDAYALSQAYGSFLNSAQGTAIGDIFSSIWGTVKKVSLAIPRGAYLSLVSLNVFNLAGHLIKCITNPDGSTDQPGIDKLQGVWHKKLSGDTNILLRAIRNGATKKAILGIHGLGAAPVAAAWAATAAVIIAAMTPIITQVLKAKNSFDSLTASQLAMQPTTQNFGALSTTTIQKYLPVILIGGVGLYLYYDKKKKR
jgi:hypothetical protein